MTTQPRLEKHVGPDSVCDKCDGPMVAERMKEGGARQIIWEWTCLTCGRTHYRDGPQTERLDPDECPETLNGMSAGTRVENGLR